MKNTTLTRLHEAADRVRAERADRPAAKSEFNETLDVHWGSGNRTGLRYAQLLWARFFSPSLVTLNFSTHTVTVKGARLAGLYEMVLAQKLRTLKTNLHDAVVTGDGSPWVENVIVLQRSGTTIEREPDDEAGVEAANSPPPKPPGPAPVVVPPGTTGAMTATEAPETAAGTSVATQPGTPAPKAEPPGDGVDLKMLRG